jgi:hypothetical protein
MRARTDHDLLADVLAEAEPLGFRGMLLDQMLRRDRRRRRTRRTLRATAAGMVIGLAIFFAGQSWVSAGAGYATVPTRPLEPSALVGTADFETASRVTSVPFFANVHTIPSAGLVRWIDDHELLALASPHPAVLIRTGPSSQTLVFCPESDRPRVE